MDQGTGSKEHEENEIAIDVWMHFQQMELQTNQKTLF